MKGKPRVGQSFACRRLRTGGGSLHCSATAPWHGRLARDYSATDVRSTRAPLATGVHTMATARSAWGIDIGNRALKAIRLVREADRLRVDDVEIIEHEQILSSAGGN